MLIFRLSSGRCYFMVVIFFTDFEDPEFQEIKVLVKITFSRVYI